MEVRSNYPAALHCPGKTDGHIYNNTQTFNCGHHACFECAINIIFNKQNCPTCKMPVNVFKSDEDFDKVVACAVQILNTQAPQIKESVPMEESVRYPFERGDFQFLNEDTTVGTVIRFINNQKDHPIERIVFVLKKADAECLMAFSNKVASSIFKDYLEINDFVIESNFAKHVDVSGYSDVKKIINLLAQNNNFQEMSAKKLSLIYSKIPNK